MNTQTQMNYIDSAKRVIEIETQAIANLADRLDSEFIAACNILFACKACRSGGKVWAYRQ